MVPASLTPPTPADSSTPVEIALVALHGDDEPVCLSRGALEHPGTLPRSAALTSKPSGMLSSPRHCCGSLPRPLPP